MVYQHEPVSGPDVSLSDPSVLADVQEWRKHLSNYSAQVVGRTLVFLEGDAVCRFQECNLGNLICDAMVRSGAARFTQLRFCFVETRRV